MTLLFLFIIRCCDEAEGENKEKKVEKVGKG
jgi:hypothetical protein